LPSAIAAAAVPHHFESAIAKLDTSVVDADKRKALLARAFELRSGREKPGRFWKIDLDALDYEPIAVEAAEPPRITAPQARGVIACDLATAARSHRDLLERVCGQAVPAAQQKFAALAAALCNSGAFIYIPADVAVDEPIEVVYDAQQSLFPYTVVLLEHGASVSIIERIVGASGAFVCGISEIVAAENANVLYAVEQDLPSDARAIFTRAATPGKDANVVWSVAEIGAKLSVGSVDVTVNHPGVDAQINGLFFPRDDQHIDLVSTVDHNVGASQSETMVKSAAIGHGQARYLGNIRIAANAQATESSLRDDALLLSPRAHIDSVPALEIAANDVKAYHGATVGALDDEQIFYMTSRGISRQDAEKMIALGFFEPVIDRFPTNALRERLRAALEAKVT
jgi:Fe-S cluster assembly protein SufD